MSSEAAFNYEGDSLLEKNNYIRDTSDEIIDAILFKEVYDNMNNIVSSCKEKAFTKAIIEIMNGIDCNEQSAEFLDSIDSTFIYHKNPKLMSYRETICLFMNKICAWSVIYKNTNEYYIDDQVISLSDLYKDYKEFVSSNLKISSRSKQFSSFKDFKNHIRKHALTKQRGQRHNGSLLRSEYIIGLPQKNKF